VTRAKDELYLLVPQFQRSRSHRLVMMKPSRFLTELQPDVTEPLVIEEGLPDLIVGGKSLPAPEGARLVRRSEASPLRGGARIPLKLGDGKRKLHKEKKK